MNAVVALRAETSSGSAEPALRDCVSRAVRRYLVDLDDHPVCDMYDLVLREIEAPLFAEVLNHFDGNQTRTAAALGINRATLRKKLRQYGLA